MSEQRARQAVVVIHGIGQQRPMSTVDSYLSAALGEHDLAFGAPDRASGHRDLRRTKVEWLPRLAAAGEDGSLPPLHTDFYELYWAHLVSGSELRHVTAWLLGLLRWHRLKQLTPRFWRFLRYHALFALGALLLAALAFLLGPRAWDTPLAAAVLRGGAGVAGGVAATWLVWHLGDVARYIDNVADNVAIQRAVRREGVELLRRLHALSYRGSGRAMYERIAVVGHSLGSVVALDIVRDYWSEVNQHYAVDPGASRSPATAAADQVDRLGEELWRAGAAPPARADAGFTPFQRAQRRLAALVPSAESRPPGEADARRWAITDLVTLACPLTHADLLLGSSREEIIDAQWRRTLASCPPRRQLTRASYRTAYTRGPRRGLESLHQSACFAVVRWTNVFFAADSVGGPLQPLFGPGIVDIELPGPRGLNGLMPRVHSAYARDPAARAILRRVIWDGGQRQDGQTLAPLLRASVEHVVTELAEQQLDDGDLHAAAASLPSLHRLTAAQRDLVVSAAVAVSGSADLGAALDQLCADADLLERMPVIDPQREQLAAEDAAAESRALHIEELVSPAAIAVGGPDEPDAPLLAPAGAAGPPGAWPAVLEDLEEEEEEEEEEEMEEEEEE